MIGDPPPVNRRDQISLSRLGLATALVIAVGGTLPAQAPRALVVRSTPLPSSHPDLGFVGAPMHLLPGQGVVAYDQMEKRIVVTDGPGAPLRMIGRRGEGPGEFRSISSMIIRGDSLIVTDAGSQRMTIYSIATGRVVTATAMPGDVTWRSALLHPASALAGGCWLGVTVRAIRTSGNARIPSFLTRTTVRVRPTAAGPQTDSVNTVSEEGQSILPYGEMIANRSPSVVATSGRTLIARDGRSVATVTPITGPRSGIIVRRWSPACSARPDSVFVPLVRREMSVARARDLYRRLLAPRQRDPATLPKAVDDALEQTERQGGTLYEPLYAGAFLGDDGAVWIEVEGSVHVADHGSPRIWKRVGPRGVLGGAVSVPRDIRLYAADTSRALGWRTGEGGASVVELGWER